MIGYLDTSAFVPLLIAEPSTEACQRFWDDADATVSSRLAYVETAGCWRAGSRSTTARDPGSSWERRDEMLARRLP